MTTLPAELWFARFAQVAAPRARLFCFPYAGGGSTIYSRWHLGLAPDIDVCAVELPGRGRRMRAIPPLFATSIAPLVDELVSAMEPLLDRPCFFFGHSMGALLAYSCARELRRRTALLPAHLFASARIAPHRPDSDASVPAMSDDQLIDMLRRRGGTTAEILAEPELMEIFLPIIRADFTLLGSYVHTAAPCLECPITALGGTGDGRVSASDLAAWRGHTAGAFAIEMFDGDHFFVNTRRDQVIDLVARTIEAALAPARRTNSPSRSRNAPLSP